MTVDPKQKLITSLCGWTLAAKQWIRPSLDVPGALIYGPGSNGWGVQTQQKALSAFASLGVTEESGLGEERREELRATALGLLEFNVASHLSGPATCSDGGAWGHTWISALGIERMMHAVLALQPWMDAAHESKLKRVLISEADWLLDEYGIVAGETENNKPESNLWNGGLLARVAAMYPDCERRDAYLEKATRYLINSLSVASDAENETVYDGMAVKDAWVGGQFFETFSLNHHGYLNVGYMVICLSNLAMLHFDFKAMGAKPPEALYHNARKLWERLKHFTFDDGRLWRIGGDTRVRYCYCQDYALPMWAWAQDYLGEDCRHWISGWLEQVYAEQATNDDGSYLGGRLTTMADVSPLYYTRLESDRAVSLSMTLMWEALAGNGAGETASVTIAAWDDDYHVSASIREPERFASFTWRAGEWPTATCLHPGDSSLCEWQGNGVGRAEGIAAFSVCKYGDASHQAFEGGFLTGGHFHVHDEGHQAEQFHGPQPMATTYVVVAALPDGHSMVILEKCYADVFAYMTRTEGLHWAIPNDIFNGGRHYDTADKSWHQASMVDPVQSGSPWVCVDERWGVCSLTGVPLALDTATTRSVGLRRGHGKPHNPRSGGFLAVDTIAVDPRHYDPYQSAESEELLHQAAVVIDSSCDAEIVARHGKVSSCIEGKDGLTVAAVVGRDGLNYRVEANLTRADIAFPDVEEGSSILATVGNARISVGSE